MSDPKHILENIDDIWKPIQAFDDLSATLESISGLISMVSLVHGQVATLQHSSREATMINSVVDAMSAMVGRAEAELSTLSVFVTAKGRVANV